MPYVITTHRHLDDPAAEFRPGADPGVSRHAVATLDEARACIRNYVVRAGVKRGTTPDPITKQGGTIGPLPDGTVITVEVETDELYGDLVSRHNR